MKSNIYHIEANRRRRDEVQEQRQATAAAVLNVAKELRKLEDLEDGRGGGDRAS